MSETVQIGRCWTAHRQEPADDIDIPAWWKITTTTEHYIGTVEWAGGSLQQHVFRFNGSVALTKKTLEDMINLLRRLDGELRKEGAIVFFGKHGNPIEIDLDSLDTGEQLSCNCSRCGKEFGYIHTVCMECWEKKEEKCGPEAENAPD